MASISPDSPNPASKATPASTSTFAPQISSSPSLPKINWNKDWRETSIEFDFGLSNPSVDSKKTFVLNSVQPRTSCSLLVFPKQDGNGILPAQTTLSASPEAKIAKPRALLAPTLSLPDLIMKQNMDRRRGLLKRSDQEHDGLHEIKSAPMFTEAARLNADTKATSSKNQVFSQYGLLAGVETGAGIEEMLHFNIAAPSSIFICGSQGSGKSHTLSCLLENCLFQSQANELPRPLTGIVFHYDTFICDDAGSPCEAAFLSTNPLVKVRVLCAPTNVKTIKQTYSRFPRVTVEELRIDEKDLNTKRMMDLMSVKSGGNTPLYMHVAKRILKQLRYMEQHSAGGGFSYADFRKMLDKEDLTDQQRVPLEQRLENLESFMARAQESGGKKIFRTVKPRGNDWTPRPSQLTIVDLSCPTMDPEGACQLFNICLSLFLEQDPIKVGRVIALDEAHKYMNESGEASALTEQLLSTIRLQRHLGARVVISTQEPTVSPKLLDLCSVTIVHRFTSPDWLRALQKHLAGVSGSAKFLEQASDGVGNSVSDSGDDNDSGVGGLVDGVKALSLGGVNSSQVAKGLFAQIVELRVGEALLFAPNAILDASGKSARAKKLSNGVLKVRIRNRVTEDGGQSVFAG
ncbi:hypothetical protein VMCG_01744 [Cytospora schulzeri]|uniref:AAA+ ATPase domain-containing protein n=1 Tax=Cytospora schulzeri TaxID=448051 RepID=A0A423X497_9PEZI|nr:hypothetical protein VMCG_01744 [Valsa malicola]